MILEKKLKETALMIAVDLSIKRRKKSPERCARNIMELGISAYPEKLPAGKHGDFYQQLLLLCKREDGEKIKELFVSVFIT